MFELTLFWEKYIYLHTFKNTIIAFQQPEVEKPKFSLDSFS